MQRASSGFLVTILVTLLIGATASVTAQDNHSSQPQPKKLRFTVVHAHFGNNCAGYLYVGQESVRYEAVAPANYASHSFQIERSAITALQPWVLMGQPQNVVEIKTAHATYHFWVMPKGTDPNVAHSSNLNASAAPADRLIRAIHDPEGFIQQELTKTRASEDDAGAERSGEEGSDADADGSRDRASRKHGQPPAGGDSSGDSEAGAQAEGEHKVAAGELEGVYVGFSLDYSHTGSRQYYFTPDGWVINNIPQVNLDNFDMTAYRNDPSHKLFIGRYRVDGNKIRIVWANNADHRDVITYDERASEPGIDTYIPTCRCTGKRFSGRYHWSSPTDQRYVQFFPDGTFFDHGLTDQVVGLPNPHGYAGITDPPRNFRGTYAIHNQKLTFSFSDGKRATVAFIAPRALEKAPAFQWFGAGHDSGVRGAETVIVLMLYEEHYQVQP